MNNSMIDRRIVRVRTLFQNGAVIQLRWLGLMIFACAWPTLATQPYELWQLTLSLPTSTVSALRAVMADTDSASYVAATLETNGTSSIFIAKVSDVGEELWRTTSSLETYTNAAVTALRLLRDGSIAVAGFAFHANSGADCFLAKAGPTGDVQWIRYFGGPTNTSDAVGVLLIDPSTNLIIAGSTGADALAVKYDVSGTLIWTSIVDGAFGGNNSWSDGDIDTNGNIYLVGPIYHPGAGTFNMLSRISPEGTQSWSANWWKPRIAQLRYDGNTNIYLVGNDGPLPLSSPGSIMKWGTDGSNPWTTQLGFPFTHVYTPLGLFWDSQNGQIVTAGRYYSSKYRYAAMALSPEGTLRWGVVDRIEDIGSGSIMLNDCELTETGLLVLLGSAGTVQYDSQGKRRWAVAGNDIGATVLRDTTFLVHQLTDSNGSQVVIRRLEEPAVRVSPYSITPTVWFPAMTQHTYRLRRLENLSSGEWQDIGDMQPISNGWNTYTVNGTSELEFISLSVEQ